jgi:hypothetical protein
MTLPTEPDATNPSEQLRALQRSKAAFLEGGAALTAALQLLAEPLSRFAERGRMSEEDWKVVQLVLTLFRNLLAIPDPRHSAASGDDHLTRQRDDLLVRWRGVACAVRAGAWAATQLRRVGGAARARAREGAPARRRAAFPPKHTAR